MSKNRKWLNFMTCLLLATVLALQAAIPVSASGSKNYLDELSSGVCAVVDPKSTDVTDKISATAAELNLTIGAEEHSDLVMANVRNALNVRSEASEEATRVGKLYKDCGGTVLERCDGWTKIQSGNLVGWAKDEYLLFDEEAEAMAQNVGRMVGTVDTETLRVRSEAGVDAQILGLLPKGEIVDVVEETENGWICIDYEGKDGYISGEFVELDFQIDSGETMDEIKAREAAEMEAKRHVNYGAYTTDADTTLLLAALIQCEAGGESYEGQVAVGAVVMNRVRSSAYPNTIHGVIYASGQFTPAMNGKVNRVYESGKISESCIRAAQDALSGTSPVGDLTHFRRNNGREGLVLGHHVFY